jgi:hypothetical protein
MINMVGLRKILLIGLLGANLSASAQDGPVVLSNEVKATRPWEPREDYTFPRIVMPERRAVAQRINRHLCMDLLEVDPDSAGDALFGNVWGDSAGTWMPRLNYLNGSVMHPLPEVLDVVIEGEACGAYCEGFTSHYVYDLRSGRYLSFDSLFTAAGMVAVNDTLHRRWRQLLSGHIAATLDTMALEGREAEELERSRAMLEMYRYCLEQRDDGDPYVTDIIPFADGIGFLIARCASHVDQELDALDPLRIDLSTAWLAQHLRADLRPLFP